MQLLLNGEVIGIVVSRPFGHLSRRPGNHLILLAEPGSTTADIRAAGRAVSWKTWGWLASTLPIFAVTMGLMADRPLLGLLTASTLAGTTALLAGIALARAVDISLQILRPGSSGYVALRNATRAEQEHPTTWPQMWDIAIQHSSDPTR